MLRYLILAFLVSASILSYYPELRKYDIMTILFRDDKCTITSAQNYSKNNIIGYVYNITTLFGDYATACSTNYMPDYIAQQVLNTQAYERDYILQNMPIFFCTKCDGICQQYNINETYSCMISRKQTHGIYYDASLFTIPYFPYNNWQWAYISHYILWYVVIIIILFGTIILGVKSSKQIYDSFLFHKHGEKIYMALHLLIFCTNIMYIVMYSTSFDPYITMNYPIMYVIIDFVVYKVINFGIIWLFHKCSVRLKLSLNVLTEYYMISMSLVSDIPMIVFMIIFAVNYTYTAIDLINICINMITVLICIANIIYYVIKQKQTVVTNQTLDNLLPDDPIFNIQLTSQYHTRIQEEKQDTTQDTTQDTS